MGRAHLPARWLPWALRRSIAAAILDSLRVYRLSYMSYQATESPSIIPLCTRPRGRYLRGSPRLKATLIRGSGNIGLVHTTSGTPLPTEPAFIAESAGIVCCAAFQHVPLGFATSPHTNSGT